MRKGFLLSPNPKKEAAKPEEKEEKKVRVNRFYFSISKYSL